LKNIGENSTAARFGDNSGRQLIRRRVDMVHFDAREPFLEGRQYRCRINLRQRSIEIERAAFGQCFLIDFIHGLRLAVVYSAKKQNQDPQQFFCPLRSPFHRSVAEPGVDPSMV
jgi:hypothetical protein